MIKLYEQDLLPFFEPDAWHVIQQACEIRQKSLNLIDMILDYDQCLLTDSLDSILGFLADVSKALADSFTEDSFVPVQYICCMTLRFRVWYQKLDDLTRHFSPHKLLRECGFSFRSLYFSCRALDELLSSWFSDTISLNPDIDFLSGDYQHTCFAPLPPDLEIDFDSSHYIL